MAAPSPAQEIEANQKPISMGDIWNEALKQYNEATGVDLKVKEVDSKSFEEEEAKFKQHPFCQNNKRREIFDSFMLVIGTLSDTLGAGVSLVNRPFISGISLSLFSIGFPPSQGHLYGY
jgi:hypothetical protein